MTVNRARKFRPTVGPCHWCGKVGKRTIDHVPPKSVFPKRVHDKLPIILACQPCNADWQKDSEYFRDMLFRGELQDCAHADLKEVRAAYERASKNRIMAGKKPSVFQTRRSWGHTPTGLHVPGQQQMIHLTRIARVIAVTAWALHLHTVGEPITKLKPSERIGWIVEFPRNALRYPRAKEILVAGAKHADGLLSYAWFWDPNETENKEYLIAFYDTAIFHLRTAPSKLRVFESGIFPGDYFKPKEQWRTIGPWAPIMD